MTARTITVLDRMEVPKGFSQRKVDDAGIMHAPGVMARAGVQLYRARELGITDKAPDEIIKIYRSPQTLADAVATFEDRALTMGHPDPREYPKGVTADNWRELSVGHINGVKAAGNVMRGRLHVADADAVRAVQTGTAELSNSYNCTLTMDAGVSPEGEEYHGTQTNIRGNHCAIIIRTEQQQARGGEVCRVLDHQQGEIMGKRIVVIMDATGKGEGVELEDAAAAIVERLQGQVLQLNKSVADSTTAHKAALEALAAEKDKLLADARSKVLTPEQLLAFVADRAALVNDCAALTPKVVIVGDMTNEKIRRAMLAELVGSSDVAKRVADAVIPGGLKEDTPDLTIKTALDTAKALVGKSIADGLSLDTTTASGLCPRTPVDDAATTKTKPVGRAAYVANLTHPKPAQQAGK